MAYKPATRKSANKTRGTATIVRSTKQWEPPHAVVKRERLAPKSANKTRGTATIVRSTKQWEPPHAVVKRERLAPRRPQKYQRDDNP